MTEPAVTRSTGPARGFTPEGASSHRLATIRGLASTGKRGSEFAPGEAPATASDPCLETGATSAACPTIRGDMADLTISPSETRSAAVDEPRDIPPGERPSSFTRLTQGAIEAERDTRIQRRASQRRRRTGDRQVTSVRFPRLAAAYAAEVPTATVTQIEHGRSSDYGGTINPAVRSLPADDIDRERFAIRKLLTKMTGEEHRLERLGHTFEADEQDTKDSIESAWRQEHWGQAPMRPPSWRGDTKAKAASVFSRPSSTQTDRGERGHREASRSLRRRAGLPGPGRVGVRPVPPHDRGA
jgi:hypothetical protein